MSQKREKYDASTKFTDCLDHELLSFYVGSVQQGCPRIKEGQRVSYIIETDASGRRFATDIRIEDDDQAPDN